MFTEVKLFTGKLKYDNGWDYKNGLPPIKKPILGDEYGLPSYEDIFRTNIDGYPYLVIDVGEDLVQLKAKDKFSIDGEQGMYTVTNIDYKKKVLEAKIDKVLDLTQCRVSRLVEYYRGWGMQKEADKVKTSHIWGYASAFVDIELCIEGKLSKNQTVQYNDDIIRITELSKNKNDIINIIGTHINRPIIQPVFPYKENGEIVCWYEDYQDVLVRGAKSYKSKLENGEVD